MAKTYRPYVPEQDLLLPPSLRDWLPEKQARGFRQFLLRGVAKVQGEWALVCTTHNILKLYRLCA